MRHFAVRDAVPDDGNFIRDAWRRSYAASPWASMFDRSLYHPVQRFIVERLLALSRVRVAHLPTDPDALFGFAVVEGPTLHYVYVKPPHRMMGVARELVGKDVAFCSHDTLISRGHASRSVVVDEAKLAGLSRTRASALFSLQFCPAFCFLKPSEVT